MESNFYEDCSKIAKILSKKQHRMDIAQDMLTTSNDYSNLLKMIITSDESWVDGYSIETEAQSSQWKADCYDWEDKRKIETGAVGDSKKCVSEVFRELKRKSWHKCIIAEGGYSEGDKIVIDT